MIAPDSIVDPRQLARARALLAPPDRRVAGVGAAVVAAGFFALAALGLAIAMVVAPPNVVTPIEINAE